MRLLPMRMFDIMKAEEQGFILLCGICNDGEKHLHPISHIRDRHPDLVWNSEERSYNYRSRVLR